jgi:hypothetical protein
MRRVLSVLAALALVGLVSGSAAAGDGNGDDGDEDLTWYASESSSTDPDPFEAGATFVFVDTLFSDEDREDEVGRNDGACTVTEFEGSEDNPETATIMCTGVITLDDSGTLTWSGAVTFEGEEESDSDEPFATIAITGGTDDHLDAGGEIDVFEEGDEGDTRYEVTLLHLDD